MKTFRLVTITPPTSFYPSQNHSPIPLYSTNSAFFGYDVLSMTVDTSWMTVDTSWMTVDTSWMTVDTSWMTIDTSWMTVDTSWMTIDTNISPIMIKNRNFLNNLKTNK